jgi:hypothetical protein
MKDTSKQYFINYVLKCLYELKFIPKSWLAFYSENIVMHKMLVKMVATSFLKHLVIDGQIAKLLILLLILL